MRSSLSLLVSLTVCVLPAAAQSALDGPLAAPDAASARPAPAAQGKRKAKTPRHVSARPVKPAPVDAAAVPAVPVAGATTPARAPDDPLSLGMKWQGSNDSAAQTRYQNLDGSAFGSGAEVGMKLHF